MNKLQGKDLINIGIFTAIYFIVIFAAASIGFIPIFIPLISVIVPLVGGIPMMLFFSKIKKFGMLTICGVLLGIIMLLTGMGYWCIPTGLIFGLISDFMMKACDYKNAKREVLIHGVFSMWVIGAFIPIVVTRDAYYQSLLPGYGQEYADTLIGYNTIAYQLNQMHIPSRTGTWGQTSIANILNNEVYLGMIRWRHEPTKRVVKDGMLVKKRVKSHDYELYEGLHDPIVTQEQWDAVKAKQRERGHVSVNTNRKLANPFASILYCEKCGALMKRNVPSKKQSTLPWYRCPTRGCNCRAIKCDFAEDAILDAMRSWLAEYTIRVKSDDLPQTDPIDTALSVVQGQLAQLRTQQDNICEYLEKGVYTVEMFTKRNETLMKELRKLQASEDDLLKQKESKSSTKSIEAEVIPTTQQILDSYPHLSVEEKNRLWKIVMKKITMYRTPEGDFTLHIYPKLPMGNTP